MPPKKEKIEWTYRGNTINKIEQTPENSFAFIYKITLEDGRYYLGKKYMYKPNYTSGKNKGKPMIYLDDNKNIVEHWKDEIINIIKENGKR